MTSPYPSGCDTRSSNADPRSPFYFESVCTDCDRYETLCNCESPELIAAREAEICADEALTEFANDSELSTAYDDHETAGYWLETLAEKMMTSACPALGDVVKWEISNLERIIGTISRLEPELEELQQAFAAAQKAVAAARAS